jgi:predicted aconitase
MVKLSDEEKAMLNGEKGPLVQKCFQILVTLGEIYGAEKMIEIQNVHSPGVSYRVAGDAGLDYVQKASEQGRFLVPTTLNTGGVDAESWRELGFPEDFSLRQLDLNAAYEKMGGLPTYTCTPYLTGSVPLAGEHVAWGESSAIIFVNSVLGARTNREGGPSALAAAVTGRVPAYGYHLDENRRATLLVEVDLPLSTDRDYAVLGYAVGDLVGNGVPVLTNLKQPRLEALKAMGAAMASSGGAALYHIEGLTAECPDRKSVLAPGYDTFTFGAREYQAVVDKFQLKSPADLVVIGCPHCSIIEMRELAEALAGRKLKTDMWVCVSAAVYGLAERSGYLAILRQAGVTLVRDTCPILGPTSAKGYKSVSTNSGKLAHYVRGLWNVDSRLAQFADCLKTALGEGGD